MQNSNKYYICLLVALLLLTTCCHQTDKQKAAEQSKRVEPLTIKIIPYGDFSQAEARNLAGQLRKKMSPLLGTRKLKVVVMENERLPRTFKSLGRDRYRADSIIHNLERKKELNVIKMGVLHEDIATSVHGVNDFGVLGLSFVQGNSCVVSTYRVKDVERQFWKVAVHEALHALGLKHCPDDDENCLMKDAKKHPRFETKDRLCPTCDSLLQIRMVKRDGSHLVKFF